MVFFLVVVVGGGGGGGGNPGVVTIRIGGWYILGVFTNDKKKIGFFFLFVCFVCWLVA